jgi:hypothetical protein
MTNLSKNEATSGEKTDFNIEINIEEKSFKFVFKHK